MLRHQHMAEVQTFQIKDVQHTRFIPNVLKFAELVSHAGGKNKFIHIQSAASGDNEGLNKLLEFLFTMFKALFAPRKQTICEMPRTVSYFIISVNTHLEHPVYIFVLSRNSCLFQVSFYHKIYKHYFPSHRHMEQKEIPGVCCKSLTNVLSLKFSPQFRTSPTVGKLHVPSCTICTTRQQNYFSGCTINCLIIFHVFKTNKKYIYLTFGAGIIFFFILAHPVYKTSCPFVHCFH